MGGNLPGQSLTLCGQPIQVAACGSHSAGMRTLLVSEEPVLNVAVGVNAAVAQERPVAAYLLDPGEIDLSQHERFVRSGLGQDDAERIAYERMAPEFDARALAAQALEPDTIDRGDPAAIGDRVAALNRFPRVELLLAVLLFLRRKPADRRGVEQNVRALQRGETRAFRIPLVPADQRPHRPDLRVEHAKAEIAGREVELLVIRGVVGDVHLPINPLDLTVG